MPLKPGQVDLTLVPYIFEINHRQQEVSCGAAVYNDPAKSVAWLAERFTQLGNPLKAGEIILSGSAVSSVAVQAGDYLRCTFGPFGEVSCSFCLLYTSCSSMLLLRPKAEALSSLSTSGAAE